MVPSKINNLISDNVILTLHVAIYIEGPQVVLFILMNVFEQDRNSFAVWRKNELTLILTYIIYEAFSSFKCVGGSLLVNDF